MWLLPFCFLLMLANPVAANTIYRWTDELGRTHFSDSPPPEGLSAERIPMPGAKAQPDAAAPARTARSANRMDSPRVRQRRCTDFRGALIQLEQIADTEGVDAQWLEAIALAQRGIRQWCD